MAPPRRPFGGLFLALVACLLSCSPALGDRTGGRLAARLAEAASLAEAGAEAGARGGGGGLVHDGSAGRQRGTTAGHLANPINKERPRPKKVDAAKVDFAVTHEEAMNFVRVLGGEERLRDALDNLTVREGETSEGLAAKVEFLRLFKEMSSAKKGQKLKKIHSEQLFARISNFLYEQMGNTEFVDWVLSEEGKDMILRHTQLSEWELEQTQRTIRAYVGQDSGADILSSAILEVIAIFSTVLLSSKKFKVACEGERTVSEVQFFRGASKNKRPVMQARKSGENPGLFFNLQPWFQGDDENVTDVAFFGRTDREVWSYEDELEAPLLGWRAKHGGMASRELPNAACFMVSTVAGAIPILKILSIYFGADGIYHLRHKCVGTLSIDLLKLIMDKGLNEEPFESLAE